MKLPNWFKISYWILLVTTIGFFFIYKKYELIESGNYLYLFIFLIWTAILLLPLFTEIKFFGIELKKEMDGLKGQIYSLKQELTNKNSQETNINVNPTPPSVERMEETQKEIKKIFEETLKAHGIQKATKKDLTIPDNVNFLFSIRYNIEKELRRINRIHFTDDKKLPLMRIMADLRQSEIIDAQLFKIIRDVYSITSPAVHGDENYVTAAQIHFVKEVGPDLIATLQEIKE